MDVSQSSKSFKHDIAIPWKTAGGGRAVPAGGVIRDGHAGLEKASGVNRNGCKYKVNQVSIMTLTIIL